MEKMAFMENKSVLKVVADYVEKCNSSRCCHCYRPNFSLEEYLHNIGTELAELGFYQDAFSLWWLLYEQGIAIAEVYNNLGTSYFYGNGIARNPQKAIHFFELAAKEGLPMAQYNLAVAYEQGVGVDQDMEKAIDLYQKAAEKSVNQAIDALIRLGLYSETIGLAFYSRNLDDDSFNGIF